MLDSEGTLPSLVDAVGKAETAVTEAETAEQETVAAGQEAKSAVDNEEAEITRLKSVVVEATERRRLLDHDSAECFTCNQSLSVDLRHRLIESVDHELEVLATSIAGATERKASAERKRQELRSQFDDRKKATGAAKTALDSAKRAHITTEQLVKTKAAVAEAVTRATTERDEAKSADDAADIALAAGPSDDNLAALQKEFDELTQQAAEVGTLEAARNAASQGLADLEGEQGNLNKSVGTLTTRIEQFEQLRGAREKALANAAQAARDAEEWIILTQAFGQDGVPNLVFAGAAQELEHDAAELMNQLSGGRYRLEMRTEKETKGSGETISALDVAVMADSGKMRPFSRLSGGEKFRVSLVLHTSLTRFLVRRSGAPIEFLGVDEGWGSLDPEGIVAMLDALRMLHEEFPLILTITHTPEVAAAFECRYEVEKDADGTSVVSLVTA